jgi:cyclopropane-fatty-acyl-phospholipid synthase
MTHSFFRKEAVMARSLFRKWVEHLLALADIRIGGNRPWDIDVRNNRFFPRVMLNGSLGLGESYMDGWWDAVALDDFFSRVLRAGLYRYVPAWASWIDACRARMCNLQDAQRVFVSGQHHYDLGEDLYRVMLDSRMIYSCGYWPRAKTLEEAQEAKLDLVCRKLGLKPGMRLLDIGCGWGGTLKFAAERYGVRAVGVTVSNNQVKVARETCRGLPVEIRLQDYRQIDETFDRVVSIGMFEHVGAKNYPTFMRVVKKCLAPDGLFLLHTIAGKCSVACTDPWIQRYIFPNSMLPSARQITASAEDLFVMEDWHSFGADYDKTLMSWYRNFEAGWGALKSRYGDRFYRMWKYYLLACAGSFRARDNQLWQIVFSPNGVPGGYRLQR